MKSPEKLEILKLQTAQPSSGDANPMTSKPIDVRMMKSRKLIIWNESGREFQILRHAELPTGYREKLCPKCTENSIGAAIIGDAGGRRAVEQSDTADPNVFCLSCGYWSDAF